MRRASAARSYSCSGVSGTGGTMLTSPAVEWPESSYELRRGEGCPMCAQGRPEETPYGARIFAGEVSDAYLQRADKQRGYTISIWRRRHVAEPTELERDEAVAYWLEVLRVGRALGAAPPPGEDELRAARQLAAAPAHARDAALRGGPAAGLAVPSPGGGPRPDRRGSLPAGRRRPPGSPRLSRSG